jgi:hypothetical protein
MIPLHFSPGSSACFFTPSDEMDLLPTAFLCNGSSYSSRPALFTVSSIALSAFESIAQIRFALDLCHSKASILTHTSGLSYQCESPLSIKNEMDC